MIASAEGIQEDNDDAPNEASTTDALSADEDGKNCCVSEQKYVESGNEKRYCTYCVLASCITTTATMNNLCFHSNKNDGCTFPRILSCVQKIRILCTMRFHDKPFCLTSCQCLDIATGQGFKYWSGLSEIRFTMLLTLHSSQMKSLGFEIC
jgi:hypothetical protein